MEPLQKGLRGGGCFVSFVPRFVEAVLTITESDLNLPLTGIAFGLVLIFLQVRTPEGSMGEKLARVDWLCVYFPFPLVRRSSDPRYRSGNLIIIAGTTLSILGLTWGGVRYPWSSAHVLAPLVIGLSLVAAFIVYEATIPQSPTIPFKVLTNRTTIGG